MGRGPALKAPGPRLRSEAALVADLNTGEELYARRADEVRSIASITKLMAALVVVERKLDLEGTTEMLPSDRALARGGARSRLDVGARVRNLDLLRAALMVSDNRSVPALGRAVGLSPEQLVAAMNAKARALGLTKTHFEDPTGLNHGNVSTARELVVLLRKALENPLIGEIARTWRVEVVTLGPRKGRRKRITFVNTDKLVPGRWWILGGKTGFNSSAGYCLAVAVKVRPRDPMPIRERDLAMVFLGTRGRQTRFAEFRRVMTWLERRGAPSPDGVSIPLVAVPRARSPVGLFPISSSPPVADQTRAPYAPPRNPMR